MPVLLVLATLAITVPPLRGRATVDIDEVSPHMTAFRMDLNQADWPELALVPGVGKKLAQRIVAQREQCGAFYSLDELREVPGIGEKLSNRIAAYLLPLPSDLPASVDFAEE